MSGTARQEHASSAATARRKHQEVLFSACPLPICGWVAEGEGEKREREREEALVSILL